MRSRQAGLSILLSVVSLVLSFLICEAAYRVWHGVPVLRLTDFRRERVTQSRLEAYAQYDPELGWSEKADWRIVEGGKLISTMQDGIRNNTAQAQTPPKGAILAVGNSFTFGSEAADDETWPAYLEALLQRSVVNAGVAGFGLDQAVLRAEMLLPRYAPGAVLLDVFEDDILRTGLSRFEKPKPYFKIENGTLVRHNHPVPRDTAEQESGPWWSAVLGRSLILDTVWQARDPIGWGGLGNEASGEDPARISCLLLRRSFALTTAAGIPLVLVLQYAGETIRERQERPEHVAALIDCAKDLDIAIVDAFEPLRAMVREHGEAVLDGLYLPRGDAGYGHHTPEGNKHLALLLASARGGIMSSSRVPVR